MPQACQVNPSENINFVRHKAAHTISRITHIRGRRYLRLMLIVNPAGRDNRHAENVLVINYHVDHPLAFSRPCRSDKSIPPLLIPFDYRIRFSDHPCFSYHIAASAKHPWLQQNMARHHLTYHHKGHKWLRERLASMAEKLESLFVC